MSAVKGDPKKRPPECKEGVFTPFNTEMKHDILSDAPNAKGRWGSCPHLKSVKERWESEDFACDVCGEAYTLYDDEIR